MFIWSLLSWDVYGIYHGSTTSDGTYRSEEIAQLLAKHNCVTVRGKPACGAGQAYAPDCSCVAPVQPVTASG